MENTILKGLVVKSIGGFYYVLCDNKEYECRARGKFRKDNIKLVVGDYVEIELTEQDKGYVINIDKRKNFLVRPPLANIDVLVLVNSICDPKPNTVVLDKMVAIAEYNKIEPIIVITKSDLQDTKEIRNVYENAGFKTFICNNITGEGSQEVKNAIKGKISAFCGNSGVGKSSLLNSIDDRFNIMTAQTSHKLGRGKHTTRHVELYKIDGGGFIADTPGFSAVELEKCQVILKDQLQYCFREFEPYINTCKFTGCSHTKEKGCRILDAVDNGDISTSRHESYLNMYEISKNIKDWDLK